MGVNKVRQLTSDAFQDESAAMAPRNDLMQRKLGRETTMFDTRQTALGGSPTAKNLAHDAAAGVDPHLALDVLTGNVHGAMRRILAAGANGMTGNTPAVRQAVANVLLKNGANLAPGELANAVDATIARIRYMQSLARAGGQLRSGAAVATGEQLGAPAPQDRLYVSPQR
jgi:hypothetical protein